MIITITLFLFGTLGINARVHQLTVSMDDRKNFPISTFGFNSGGGLIVLIKKFSFQSAVKGEHNSQLNPIFGLSLQRSTNDVVASYTEEKSRICIVGNRKEAIKKIEDDKMDILLMKINTPKNANTLEGAYIDIHSFGDSSFKNISIRKIDTSPSNDTCMTNKKWLASHASAFLNIVTSPKCLSSTRASSIPLNKSSNHGFVGGLAFSMSCSKQSGLYNLYFHNCGSYNEGDPVLVNFEVELKEYNQDNYLSVGEMPLPWIYGFVSLAFFVAGCTWVYILCKKHEWVFKVHWLMALVIFLKSSSVGLHAINYYLIGICGLQVEAWAILFYIVHLVKGSLMFTNIMLIGTGYFFMKHVLTSKEKKLFTVVIPLQIITNIAQIIIAETEEGDSSYKRWSQIMMFVDLLCCGAILLPVIWSIKHLQEASKTDGKAATSLEKLKLFRHFYVMIVAYIYFTRIVVYLLKITVPFQYMFIDELFTEAATYVFFMLTGFKFRPADNNPYLHVPVEEPEDDIEMQEISDHSGYGSQIKRVNRSEHT